MASKNSDVENAKARFRGRFRYDRIGLVYSRGLGGEARRTSEVEARDFITEFDELVEDGARSLKLAVLVSFLLPIPLGTLAIRLHAPIIALVALVSFFTWLFVFAVQIWLRYRFDRRVWNQMERRATAPKLSHHEKVNRGFAMPYWQWLLIPPFLGLLFVLKAPTDTFPLEWQHTHAVFRFSLLLVGGTAIAVAAIRTGIPKLIRKWKAFRNS